MTSPHFCSKLDKPHDPLMNDQEKFVFDLINDLEIILDDVHYDFGYENVPAEKLEDLIQKAKEYQESL